MARRAHGPEVRDLAGDHECNVILACARAVARDLGAQWVVLAKVSKTSNLIWLLTGQLVNVGTGEIVMDDSTELKGDPEPMIRAGVRIFAERVARTVKERSGGDRALLRDRALRSVRSHSWRSASTGSIPAARFAG